MNRENVTPYTLKSQRKRPLSSSEKPVPLDKKYCLNLSTTSCDSSVSEMASESSPVHSGGTKNITLEHVMSELAKLNDTQRKIQVEVAKISQLQNEVTDLNANLMEYRTSLEFCNRQLSDAVEEIAVLRDTANQVDKLKSEITQLKATNAKMETKMLQLEAYSRRENLVFEGIAEQAKENCEKLIQDTLTSVGLGNIQFQRCHRLQFQNLPPGKPKPIITRFALFPDKISVLKKREDLRKKGIIVHDDNPPEVARSRALLRPVLNHLQANKEQASFVLDKLKFRNKLYSFENINDIPVDITSIGTKASDSHVFFAGEYSPLSNLHPCRLETEERIFPSSEHLYQYERALALDRNDVAEQVLETTTPRDAMIKGKQIKATDEWTKTEGLNIMKTILQLKFETVPRFRDLVLQHHGKIFVEASRHQIWGIGLPFTARTLEDSKSWNGDNLMGKALGALGP